MALTAPTRSEFGPECEGGDHRLAVAIVEHEIFGVAREAGALLFDGLGEACFVNANAERAREQDGMFLERFGVGFVDGFDVGEIFFEARAVEAGLI